MADSDIVKMNNLVASIKEKMNEKNELLKQLEMWSSVKAEGIDVAQVDSFGFDPFLVPKEELLVLEKNNEFLCLRNKNQQRFSPYNPYCWETEEVAGVQKTKPKIFNYVKMKNGDKVALKNPIPSPSNK